MARIEPGCEPVPDSKPVSVSTVFFCLGGLESCWNIILMLNEGLMWFGQNLTCGHRYLSGFHWPRKVFGNTSERVRVETRISGPSLPLLQSPNQIESFPLEGVYPYHRNLDLVQNLDQLI
jgi:hypothetical protein